jgi:hypothetical protein
MKRFKFKVRFSVGGYIYVDAEDRDQAYELAEKRAEEMDHDELENKYDEVDNVELID